jgi:hypothetical protein
MSDDDKPLSGMEQMELYGACVAIVLVIFSPVWVPDLLRWAINNWPVQ